MGFEDEDEEDGDEVVIVPQTVKASPGLPARASEDDKSSFKILCRAKSFFSLSQLSVWITSPPLPQTQWLQVSSPTNSELLLSALCKHSSKHKPVCLAASHFTLDPAHLALHLLYGQSCSGVGASGVGRVAFQDTPPTVCLRVWEYRT